MAEFEARWRADILDPAVDLIGVVAGHSTLQRGWGFTDRVLDDHMIYWCEEGFYRAAFEGGEQVLGPDSLLWLGPGTRHTVGFTPDPGPLTLYHFRVQWVRAGTSLGFGHGPMTLAPGAGLGPLMRRLWDLWQRTGPWRTTRMRSMLTTLYAEAAEVHMAGDHPEVLPAPARQAIHRLLRRHPPGRLSVTDLSRAVGLGPDRFTRRFTRTFGEPPRTWLVRQRLERAKIRLADHPEENISEVALAMGFADVFGFSRLFKRYMGQTPSAWRRRAGRFTHPPPR